MMGALNSSYPHTRSFRSVKWQRQTLTDGSWGGLLFLVQEVEGKRLKNGLLAPQSANQYKPCGGSLGTARSREQTTFFRGGEGMKWWLSVSPMRNPETMRPLRRFVDCISGNFISARKENWPTKTMKIVSRECLFLTHPLLKKPGDDSDRERTECNKLIDTCSRMGSFESKILLFVCLGPKILPLSGHKFP